MRGMEFGLGEAGRVGRDQRQVATIGKLDQGLLGGLLGRIAAPRQLDIEPPGEQPFERVRIARRRIGLFARQQLGERALGAAGQRDQPVGAPFEHRDRHVRLLVHRPFEMGGRDERAEIVVPRRVLRVERQPVDDQLVDPGPPDREQGADDRLDAVLLGRVRKGHRRVEPVAVGQRRGGEAELLRLLGDRLGLDRAFEHRIGGENPQRHEGLIGHGPNVCACAGFASVSWRLSTTQFLPGTGRNWTQGAVGKQLSVDKVDIFPGSSLVVAP